jgi:death-on-curing protein
VARQSITVAELAKEADLDVESALVSLWRMGIEHVNSGSSRLSDSERRKALRSLDLAGAYRRKVSYWLDWLGVDRDRLASMLLELGIVLDPRSNNLPKGAIKKLQNLPPAMPVEESDPRSVPDAQTIVVPPPEFLAGNPNGSISFLSVDEVRAIHDSLEEDFAASDDPIYPIGVRSVPLLEGAVERHSTRFGGQWKYPGSTFAGAALLHGLVHNHPFHNGNKRTALVSLLVFLDRNGRVMQSDERELFQWMVQVAAHDLLAHDRVYQSISDHEVVAIANWIEKHTRKISRDERSVQWRVLRGVLREHGCSVEPYRGEKQRITRIVQEKTGRGLFRRSKGVMLVSFYVNTGDGREVPKTQVKKIRQELRLDEAHGYDSDQFYSPQRAVDFFILEYSKTLKRLARV